MSIPTSDPFTLLEVIGTVAFAVSGGAVAIRAGMDWLGVVVLAIVTAVGGGTLRDLLIGQSPVFWVSDPWPIALAAVTAIGVIVVGHRFARMALDSRGAVLVADAAGLAAFTVIGTQVSLEAGIPGAMAALLGVVTGAGGGVIRDVLARQRPLILIGQIYALAALSGAVVVVVLTPTAMPADLTRWIGVVVILAIRLAAIRWQWTLPRYARADEDSAPEGD